MKPLLLLICDVAIQLCLFAISCHYYMRLWKNIEINILIWCTSYELLFTNGQSAILWFIFWYKWIQQILMVTWLQKSADHQNWLNKIENLRSKHENFLLKFNLLKLQSKLGYNQSCLRVIGWLKAKIKQGAPTINDFEGVPF